MATRKKKNTNSTKKEKTILNAQNSLKKGAKKTNNISSKKKKINVKDNNFNYKSVVDNKVKNVDGNELKITKILDNNISISKNELENNTIPIIKKKSSNNISKKNGIKKFENQVKINKKKKYDNNKNSNKSSKVSSNKSKNINIKIDEKKKKIAIEDAIYQKEEEKKEIDKLGNGKEEREKRKEKRNSKIKELSSTLIVNVKEKTSDENIPSGDEKEDRKKRIKRYLLEAIGFSLAITFINILAIWLFDYANYIKIFDVKIVNIALTIFLSLIFNYALSFFIDSLVTELWIKYKTNAKKEGVQDGNKRINEREHKDNIQN